MKAMVGEYLMAGNKKSESYVQIDENDLKKIENYFKSSTSLSALQDEALYNILYFFQYVGEKI